MASRTSCTSVNLIIERIKRPFPKCPLLWLEQSSSADQVTSFQVSLCLRALDVFPLMLSPFPVRSNLLQNVDFGTETSTTGIPIESICGQLFVHLNRRNTVSNLRRINPHCSVVGAIIGDILGTALLYTSQSL